MLKLVMGQTSHRNMVKSRYDGESSLFKNDWPRRDIVLHTSCVVLEMIVT